MRHRDDYESASSRREAGHHYGDARIATRSTAGTVGTHERTLGAATEKPGAASGDATAAGVREGDGRVTGNKSERSRKIFGKDG